VPRRRAERRARRGGLFLPEGTLLATIVDEDGDEREERSRSGLLQGVALTLLVGPATASAAEVFAAALADHGRAELRGERTRGKGALSELVAAPGGLVEVARGQTLRPSGAPLSGRGVVSRERP
jgi:carboxyl-terminal processing protease